MSPDCIAQRQGLVQHHYFHIVCRQRHVAPSLAIFGNDSSLAGAGRTATGSGNATRGGRAWLCLHGLQQQQIENSKVIILYSFIYTNSIVIKFTNRWMLGCLGQSAYGGRFQINQLLFADDTALVALRRAVVKTGEWVSYTMRKNACKSKVMR